MIRGTPNHLLKRVRFFKKMTSGYIPLDDPWTRGQLMVYYKINSKLVHNGRPDND